MKKALIFLIIGCFFVATLSGCVGYVIPPSVTYTDPGTYSNYNASYSEYDLALAATRFRPINEVVYDQGIPYDSYAPVAVPVSSAVAVRKTADGCEGLTPWQCSGFDINKNVKDGRASLGNQNYRSGNHGNHSNDFHSNRRGHDDGNRRHDNNDDHNRRRRGR